VRSLFYRIAMIAGQGGLVYIAGHLTPIVGGAMQAWAWVFGIAGAFFFSVGLYHGAVLPKPAGDGPVARGTNSFAGFFRTFAEFFRKKDLGRILAFLLLYRLAEAQLLRLVTPFLLDARADGGLGLTTEDVGIAYGTVGVIALILGGLLGGYAISRFGLKRMLWPMVAAINAPNLVYVLLAIFQPTELAIVSAGLACEQFGYGFGFTAYMVYMMLVAEGPHRTVHYSICTGIMALGMMLPGMKAGAIQETLGYVNFFIWVCVATIPSFLAAALVKIDPAFGRKA
jgi:MFS transporter, PAT family, beta-lactamase induction signal transducer AmpG